MTPLSERLLLTKGRPAGFDYMRVGLATMIVIYHTVATSYGKDAQEALSIGISRPIWAIILPMFFALSGFLVSGSLERSKTLVNFLGLRIIRLLPALAVESIIAMIILGPIFTKLSIKEYFSSYMLYSYLLNIVGEVQYHLPGVFTQSPDTVVNGQLWTLPFEMVCYAIIAAIAVAGAYRLKALMAATCILAQGYVAYRVISAPPSHLGDYGVVGGSVLVLSFLCGSLLYRFRDSIPYSGMGAAASLVLCVITLSAHKLTPFAAFPAAYLTVYLGLLDPPRNKLVSSGDYSYGIFLYGYPIQQSVAALFPSYRFWWVNLIVSIPIIFGVAALSWHLVEKKALSLRPALKRIEDRWLPFNDFALKLFGNMMPASLRSRWTPARLLEQKT